MANAAKKHPLPVMVAPHDANAPAYQFVLKHALALRTDFIRALVAHIGAPGSSRYTMRGLRHALETMRDTKDPYFRSTCTHLLARLKEEAPDVFDGTAPLLLCYWCAQPIKADEAVDIWRALPTHPTCAQRARAIFAAMWDEVWSTIETARARALGE